MSRPLDRVREAGAAYTRRAVNRARAALHRPDVDVAARIPHPPVFIIGPPRSGTTVLYQLLVDRYRVAYFANIHCRWYGAPDKAERRHHPWARPPQGDYASSYGQTRGPYGPSECGDYWYRFFRRKPQAVTVADVDERRMHAMRASIAALVQAAGRPFLFKNLPCALRLLPLGRFLPEALFVVVDRDELEIGQSLLEGRMRLHGDLDQWFSLEPPGWERLLERPPEEQVIEQVRLTNATILTDAEIVGPHRFHHVAYDRLCEDVPGTLDEIASFLAGHGVSLEEKGAVPTTLDARRGVRIDQDVYDRMVAYAEQGGG